ncbi:hypothetical protein QQF40_07655 [Cobetia sp. LC6]|uniref:hypothetical protein n=1 Tax=Cobetia sp. LC6 TaxID=3050947 RepID=UPI0025552A0D|nr:hypothetical protein [Cobetia sp. LC6]MDL2191266.1 hypothetical protein [Cobetia sp. LC6]
MKKADILRDAAVKLESIDINLSLQLMEMALSERPTGKVIKAKLLKYYEIVKDRNNKLEVISKRVSNGELAIIPIGFRCYTKKILGKNSILQASLPFDNGFFPSSSVASIIINGEVDLVNCGVSSKHGHDVCIKKENLIDGFSKKYIHFRRSDYHDIDEFVSSSKKNDLNNFLDSTRGYYTLDRFHNYVLAHYNWHKSADSKLSKGISDPVENIKAINDIMNKRIARMNRMCESASDVFFIYYNHQGYDYMKIDDCVYEARNLGVIRDAVVSKYGYKCQVKEVSSDCDLLSVFEEYLRETNAPKK